MCLLGELRDVATDGALRILFMPGEHGIKQHQGLLNKRTGVSTLSAPIESARPF